MRRHEEFEWDRAKAEANLWRHGVSFELAAHVLADELGDRFHVEGYDMKHSMREDRWLTIGSVPMNRRVVLAIVWTMRKRVTRIVSARRVNRMERTAYEKATNA